MVQRAPSQLSARCSSSEAMLAGSETSTCRADMTRSGGGRGEHLGGLGASK